MKTGLVSISFRNLAPEAIVALATGCGLDAIEWGGDVHVPAGDIARALEVGDMTRRAGLEVACYGSYYRLTDGEAPPDAVIATAKTLGAKLIRVWAGTKGSAEATDGERAMVVENARRMAMAAGAEGMDIAFEFHGGTLTDDTGSAFRLLGEVDMPNVYTLWQPPVDMPDDECLKSLNVVSGHVRNIHVFTWKGRERLPLEAGAGKWKPLIERIAGLAGEHSLMLEFVAGDDPAQLAADAACLKRWMEEIER